MERGRAGAAAQRLQMAADAHALKPARPAPHSNPITAVKWDYVSSNVMIEHNGGALAGKYTNAASYPSRRCVACETTLR